MIPSPPVPRLENTLVALPPAVRKKLLTCPPAGGATLYHTLVTTGIGQHRPNDTLVPATTLSGTAAASGPDGGARYPAQVLTAQTLQLPLAAVRIHAGIDHTDPPLPHALLPPRAVTGTSTSTGHLLARRSSTTEGAAATAATHHQTRPSPALPPFHPTYEGGSGEVSTLNLTSSCWRAPTVPASSAYKATTQRSKMHRLGHGILAGGVEPLHLLSSFVLP